MRRHKREHEELLALLKALTVTLTALSGELSKLREERPARDVLIG